MDDKWNQMHFFNMYAGSETIDEFMSVILGFYSLFNF
jgi:hypothetical protein